MSADATTTKLLLCTPLPFLFELEDTSRDTSKRHRRLMQLLILQSLLSCTVAVVSSPSDIDAAAASSALVSNAKNRTPEIKLLDNGSEFAAAAFADCERVEV